MIIFTYICLIKIITIMNDKGLTFGEAIEAVKKGELACREGWNGKGMFLLYNHVYNYYLLFNCINFTVTLILIYQA